LSTQHHYQCAASSHVGQIRRNNEDAFIVTQINAGGVLCSSDATITSQPLPSDELLISSENGLVITLADGMGGAQAGEIAAQITVQTIHKAISNLDDPSVLQNSPGPWMDHIIKEANQQIIFYAEAYPDSKGMGTTCVLAYVSPSLQCHIAWVGDSRAYLYNRRNGLRQVTKDHSLVQELVDLNQITQDDAFNHPDSNIITQSLGGYFGQLLPSHVQFNLEEQDILLLCTDGLNSMLKEHEIEAIITQHINSDASGTVEALIQAANAAGGLDNITISIYKVKEVLHPMLQPTEEPHLVFYGAATGAREHFSANYPKGGIKGSRRSAFVKILLGLVGMLCIAFLFYLRTFSSHFPEPDENTPQVFNDSADLRRQDSFSPPLRDSFLSNKALRRYPNDSTPGDEHVTLQVVSNLVNSEKAEELADQLVEMGYDAECQCGAVPFKVLVHLPTLDSALEFKSNFSENYPEVVKKYKLKDDEFALLTKYQ
jgi:serine/threonine protein phosphatase PrpC